MYLIDSHCHFDFSQFDADRARVWQACLDNQVRGLIIPGVAPEQWSRGREVCSAFRGMYYSAGLHPWWIDNYFTAFNSVSDGLTELEKRLGMELANSDCITVGECGLDKLIKTPLDRQKVILQSHLSVAREFNKPLMLHCRQYHSPLIQILKKTERMRGVVHGFSGSAEIAAEYWKLGFHIGVGGTITYPRANKTREAIKQLPLEALVLETDAPDMPLDGKQGQRNSPLYLAEVATALAELRGDTLENIARQTTANTLALYGLQHSAFCQA